MGLSEQPQLELYELFTEHLRRIERLANQQTVYPYLAQAVYHLLAIAGVAPQVQACGISQKSLLPDFTRPHWQVGFSFDRGSVIDLNLEEINSNRAELTANSRNILKSINYKINPLELALLQQLSSESLPQLESIFASGSTQLSLDRAWIRVERILREYAQYYCGRSLRSADLIDNLYLVEF